MASNSFGTLFRITTWGESHGPCIGVTLDGCPANIPLSENDINESLQHRSPGKRPGTSARKEPDQAQLLSGVFQGKTTGAPISILITNQDVDSSHYEAVKTLLKPGHANSTYQQKYGCFDYRGGGRASARETACRVAAGAIAKKILASQNIIIIAYLKQIHNTTMPKPIYNKNLAKLTLASPLFCPCPQTTQAMLSILEKTQCDGDSVGGLVEFVTLGLPAGLGDPVYEKIEAKLAHAMLSIPASKGFEIGEGFNAVTMLGSEHNDPFSSDGPTSNHAGGTLGGITTGLPLLGRVAFKPTSSIKKPQQTTDFSGTSKTFALPPGSRHDPCVAIRAVPVVEAMAALVLVDALLMQQAIQLPTNTPQYQMQSDES